MSTVVSHPISIDTVIEVTKPICPCKGGGNDLVTGKVLKVITNQSGFWYYLDIGITVKADRVQRIITPNINKGIKR